MSSFDEVYNNHFALDFCTFAFGAMVSSSF